MEESENLKAATIREDGPIPSMNAWSPPSRATSSSGRKLRWYVAENHLRPDL